ncbi:MAG: GDP-L-fucose synthase [Acidimicrobiales bacterium]|nr:GDP-L-fucose synthase [Acidimicrobiales bacterium]
MALTPDTKIYVAGHGGLVGSALLRRLEQGGFHNILTATRQEVDLRNQAEVSQFLADNRPQQVILAAGKVGGIHANNSFPAEFLYDNLMIHGTIVHAAHEIGVEKLLYLGSSCIYPRNANQPITEDALLTGALEPTNEGYALAKIAGIKMCETYKRQYGDNFVSAMPTNLYGPNDNFDLDGSHVIPALMRKFHEAKLVGSPTVEIWGTGSAMREFLHVDDLADALIFLLDNYDGLQHVNVGTGEDQSIRDLANLIGEVVYPEAQLVWDSSKPDGTPRKVMDVSKLHKLGWRHKIDLRTGLGETYKWFIEHYHDARGIAAA